MFPQPKPPAEHAVLAGLIERVLRWKSGPLRVPDLAEATGFSRFHLTRRFHLATGETLEGFLRRVRLERAAYWLRTGRGSVLEIATESGYRSPEAFARAFRGAFGMKPTAFRRRTDISWHLESPAKLHWNEHWVDEVTPIVESDVLYFPVRTAIVWRVVGNYAHLSDGWARFAERFEGQIPEGATFISIYLDNMWTHPNMETMRADIGWLADPMAGVVTVPKGMRRLCLAAGRYAVSRRFVERTERNDAWSYMSGKWAVDCTKNPLPSYDEYAAWPLPFEQVRTRLLVGLNAL